jgi:CopG family nickel-responsive transcriptional regulator
MTELLRFGVSMDAELLAAFDLLITRKGYSSRSEAIRDLVRDAIVKSQGADATQSTVAALCMVYDHHAPELTNRLTSLQHDFNHEIISTLHVHLDHRHCLEVIVLRGPGRGDSDLRGPAAGDPRRQTRRTGHDRRGREHNRALTGGRCAGRGGSGLKRRTAVLSGASGVRRNEPRRWASRDIPAPSEPPAASRVRNPRHPRKRACRTSRNAQWRDWEGAWQDRDGAWHGWARLERGMARLERGMARLRRASDGVRLGWSMP